MKKKSATISFGAGCSIRNAHAIMAKQQAIRSCAESIHARLVPYASRIGAQRNFRLQGSPMIPVQNVIAEFDIPIPVKMIMETTVATANGRPSLK